MTAPLVLVAEDDEDILRLVEIRLQQEGVSTQLVSTLPYLVVVVVLTLTAIEAQRRGRPREVTTT